VNEILKSYLRLIIVRVYHVQEEQNASFKRPIANNRLLFTRFLSLYSSVVNFDFVNGTTATGF
jgi:hypothetical protein